MPRRSIALAISLVVASSLAAAPNSRPSAGRVEVTTWSRSAQPLPYAVKLDPAMLSARIPSPNGHYEIACNAVPAEQRISESVSERVQTPSCVFVASGKRMPIDLQIGPEALWSPDSEAVAITHSRGGALGTYQVLIYRPENNGPVDIATSVRQDLARRYPACAGAQAGCTARARKQMQRNVQWVNVAAIRWMENSDRLLMMAWVPDSTEFGANFGRLNGYLVDARTGHILTRYSEHQFKQRFKNEFGDWGF